MNAQRPELLWLLVLLLVPLLLYLLPMPRRRVYSTALFLWERFLQSEVLGRATERFRRALGFALLAVILASLIAAAAGLGMGGAGLDARRLVVLVDASASISAVVDGRSNLDRAKQAAEDLVASLPAATELLLAEAAGTLNPLSGFEPAGTRAVECIAAIQPFDGPTDLARALADAFQRWGQLEDCRLCLFTDGPLPESRWGSRAHVWIAPPAGDNLGLVAITAERHGKQIHVRCTSANFRREVRSLEGTLLVNQKPRAAFRRNAIAPGQTAEHVLSVEEPQAAEVCVRLDTGPDALQADNQAYAVVPALDALRVGVVWPSGGKRNAYVTAALASLEQEGVIGPISDARGLSQFSSDENGTVPLAGTVPLTVFVNEMPKTWPDGGAIVLYPLRSGAIEVLGLHAEPATVTGQADHPVLRDVELRGLEVRSAVRIDAPTWAEPIAWAGEVPLLWAGRTEGKKVLLVAVPLSTEGSRWPLAASFPLLMRNACRWMLPQARVLRPGETVGGWTARRAGICENPADGRRYGFNTASAAESDLRRDPTLQGETFGSRRSLAVALVVLACVLLPVEWGLFHRRITE